MTGEIPISENNLRAEARVAAFAALLAAFITMVMGVLALAEANVILAAVEMSSTATALTAFWFVRRGRFIEVATIAVILAISFNVAFSAVTGANLGTLSLAWWAIIVLGAYAVAGRTVGLVAGVASLVFIAFLFSDFSGAEFNHDGRPIQTAVHLVLMIAASLGIIWLFENKKESEVAGQRRIVDALRKTNQELEVALDKVQSLQARLIEAERHGSLQRLAGHFAHDFNNLLTGIMAEVDLAKMVSDQADVREGLENALESATKAAKLTRSMLTYSGKRTTRFTEAKASDILRDVSTLAKLGTRHGVNFETAGVAEDVSFEGDPSQLEQALLNLVLNGAQASDEQKPTIEFGASSKHLAAAVIGEGGTRCEPGDVIELSVRDFGRGIPDEMKEQIFEPYFTTREEGQGLGLSSVVGIVRAHHGAITVEPAEPGTRFSILIPVQTQRDLTRRAS